jgi:hypothetical protein
MLSFDKVNFFTENGYLVLNNDFLLNEIFNFQYRLWQIINYTLEKESIKFICDSHILANKCSVGLIALRNVNPAFPGLVQSIISRSPEYYRLCSLPYIMQAIRKLINFKKDVPLYLTNNGVIFTNPFDADNKRPCNIELNWHKDTFYTIPRSHFLHVWMPLLHDANEKIGTLQLCPKSHKDGIGHQLIDIDAQYDHRYQASELNINKYQPISLEVKLGQVLLFDGNMFHRSGVNTSQHVRCTLIGLHHDVLEPSFEPIVTSYSYKKETPEEYFYQLFSDDSVKPFLKEQAFFTNSIDKE